MKISKKRHYATGQIHKKLIALVPIRATDPVAILIHCNHSCPFVQFVGNNISLRTSAWNFRASERRAELVRAMPSAAENLEEVALQSVAIVTGDEVLGRTMLERCAWKALQSEAMVTGYEVPGVA